MEVEPKSEPDPIPAARATMTMLASGGKPSRCGTAAIRASGVRSWNRAEGFGFTGSSLNWRDRKGGRTVWPARLGLDQEVVVTPAST